MTPPAFFRAALARTPRLGAVLGFACWVLALAAGFRILVEYQLKAGAPAVAPAHWQADLALKRDPARVTLVMFAHPQCPCSRASMAELAVVMTRCAHELRAVVCFYDPDGEPEEWTHSALWRSASAIPGVEVIADHNARLAERFGSATSGQVFLFDRDGRQIFAGGITGARGHEGENPGRALVIALAKGEVCSSNTTPVFGCSLHDAPLAMVEARKE